jgi:hypothetical protein
MKNSTSGNTYSLSGPKKIIYIWLPVFGFYVFVFTIFLFIVLNLIPVIFDQISFIESNIFLFAIGLAIVLALVPMDINKYSDLRVIDEGIFVRTFNFVYSWKFIPWDYVTEIKKIRISVPIQTTAWIVPVRNLGLYHKLLGFRYGFGFRSCILISQEIENVDELITKIKEELKKIK